MTTGFKLFTNPWDISKEQPTLWIKVDREFLEGGFTDDLLEQPGKILAGIAKERQRFVLLQDIFNQYNSISLSFLRLAITPMDDFDTGEYSDLDTPYSVEAANERTIKISITGTGTAGGFAQPISSEGKVIACNISISPSSASFGHTFWRVVNHEIGHCLGLAHNHGDTDSIMSYNSGGDQISIDDQMGIINQYPLEESYAKEALTLGGSCEPQ